ncbi:cation:proton antiporter [Kallotenue papyrolyticum]|uniref:cation:proton antiporter n=1 Tax=Kallotenue papyrolyticum TaxID=1325125 RepID=UPI000492CCB2|nr:cation:proton antiporter [Kallotenue papyrolyticum]
METTFWFVIIGALLILMALLSSLLSRLPLTAAIVYLAVGVLIGPYGLGIAAFEPLDDATLLERLTEIAVIVSLFTAGLKLRVPFRDRQWRIPLRLAFGVMVLTVGLVTLVGVGWLGLPLGAAVLLGAILAPTDPVLASEVQVEGAADRDRLRFGLTGEAGFNDGTAFPFVMLGLGLLGLHELEPFGLRWLAVDVLWAVLGGLGLGGLLGTLVGHLVLYLRQERREAVGTDDFLALGLIAFAYGLALLLHTYGFLAVFAAGLALRRVERRASQDRPAEEIEQVAAQGRSEEIATHPETAPAFMAQAVLGFNEQLEHIAAVGVVILVGNMLTARYLTWEVFGFALLLVVVLRPLAVALGLLGSATNWLQRGLMGWFGLRGIGSVYYLMYAIAHGLAPEVAVRLVALTLTTVALSVVLHGISVTPLMRFYGRYMQHRAPEQAHASPAQG